jgi:CubicO group peptidase (beta-lactamase class C family)
MKQRVVQAIGRWYLSLVMLLVIAGTPLPAAASVSEAVTWQANASALQQGRPTDAVELERFLDNWVTQRMADTPLYSLGFVMVKDGEIFFAKGYGADPLTGKAFDAETTTVRVASVAKLFTATAAMQLYDRGLIDLHEDVNRYLTAIQLADEFPEPITFHHLLTHTEGFERWFIGVRPNDPESLISLEEFYTTRRAKRILPPGQMVTYDNYASGLLGLLIEEVSGMPYADYMAEYIFDPLGMDSSTFVQPPPPDIQERIATEYELDRDTGEYVPMPARLSHLAPAGGMHSSLMDIGHFLVAILGDGSYGGGRILSQETVQMMYPQRFASHPRMPGMTYGLLEDFPNGHRVLRRDGDSMNAWSRIYLMPDEQTGLFLVAVGDEASRVDLSWAFFDRFFPRAEPLPQPSSAVDLDRYRGTYHPVSDTRSTFGKTVALVMGDIRVTPNADGTLAMRAMGVGDFAGGFEGTTKWVEVEPGFFERSDGRGYVAFGEDEDGRITHMYSGQRYMGNYRRLAWYELPTVHYALIAFFLFVSLFAFISWGMVPLVRRLKGKPRSAGPAHWATVLMGVFGTLSVLFSVLWFPAVFVIGMQAGEPAPAYGVTPLMRITFVLPVIAALLTVGLVYFAWRAWREGYWSVARRIQYTVITVAALGLILWTHYWNLLGFRF